MVQEGNTDRITGSRWQMSAPFLAWTRTALAILAGSIAIDQLAPRIAPVPVRVVLCVVLAGIGALLAVEAYRRRSLQEQAMRHLRFRTPGSFKR